MNLLPFQVILFQLPTEIVWSYTLLWEASGLACKVVAFLRMVGFHLSGFIMMVISIDRLQAVFSPVTHRWISAFWCFRPFL